MKSFEVSEEVLQSLLDYLAKRPYLEVYQLVQAIQKSKPVSAPEVEQPKAE